MVETRSTRTSSTSLDEDIILWENESSNGLQQQQRATTVPVHAIQNEEDANKRFRRSNSS
jgi:hypothetical protein